MTIEESQKSNIFEDFADYCHDSTFSRSNFFGSMTRIADGSNLIKKERESYGEAALLIEVIDRLEVISLIQPMMITSSLMKPMVLYGADSLFKGADSSLFAAVRQS